MYYLGEVENTYNSL